MSSKAQLDVMKTSSCSDVAIRVSNLGKSYQIYDRPEDHLKQSVLPRLQRLVGLQPKNYHREFWALKDISFEVKKGETIGIIGRNGAGKSTLLQIICGTLPPSSGDVEINGRVAALLELGSGFNPEFTGRENVYMNAAILGLSNDEIDAKYQDIADFADIGEFIEQPVKSYSSGMLVRLAFSVIAYVDADILVVDEALAVGDAFFAQKCMRFFESFQSGGGTLLFVSHDTSAVLRLCHRSILLSKGRLAKQGISEELCKLYLEQLYSERGNGAHQSSTLSSITKPASTLSEECLEFSITEQEPNQIFVSDFNPDSEQMGLGGVEIVDAGYFDENGMKLTKLLSGNRAVFSIFLTSNKRIQYPAVGLVLKDRLGQAVFTESTTWAFGDHYGEDKLEFIPGDVVRVDFDHILPILFEGEYSMTVAVAEGYGHDHVQHHYIHDALILNSAGCRILHGITGFEGLKTVIRIFRGISKIDQKTSSVERA